MEGHDPVEVYYDAQCPLCAAAAEALAGRDALGSLRLLPTHAAPPGAPSEEAMLHRIHVRAQGRWLSGARGLERALRELPGTRALRALIRAGLWLGVAEPIYDCVARHRMHLGPFIRRTGRTRP